MPKITIDGKEIEVAKGTSVIEAAKQADTDIPFYCYHPGLSVAGNCRMCLVEVEKMPKLQIACHMQAQDGMVVHTKTERVEQTRKHILEFLLVNHPVDCPVCDQAGECWLQDYYLNYGAYQSRLNENKVKKKKAQLIGPNVMLDQERCILCSRCVRFTDEISKTKELGIMNRGDHCEVGVFPGTELDNPYSSNVVDICPVGALTDKDFRFKMRVWYLKSENTLCNGCSRGCNIMMQYRTDRGHHAKGERIMRLKPRVNEKVNQWWMCDEGRYGYKFHDHNRILSPMKRAEGLVSEMEWNSILSEVAQKMESSEKKIGIFLSPQLSNEDLYLAHKLFSENLKKGEIHLVSPNKKGFEDDILIRADKNPNSKGAEMQGIQYNESLLKKFFDEINSGEVEGLILFGQDVLTLYSDALSPEAWRKLCWSVFIGTNHHVTSEYATYVLPAATYAEKQGTFTNFEGITQIFNRVIDPLEDAVPEWKILINLAAKLNVPHFHYDDADDIFNRLVETNSAFSGLSYKSMQTGGSDMRSLAMPMIPSLEQESKLIFHSDESKNDSKVEMPEEVKTT